MEIDEIKAMQINNQHLSAPADMLSVAKDLCGLQAQFFSNSIHALRIRSKAMDAEEIQRNFAKGWTLRGTMHLFAKDDFPLFFRGDAADFRKNKWDKPSFWNRRPGWKLSPERQAHFTDVILAALSGGPMEREKLKEICVKNGMTDEEAGSMFDPWGGGVREMFERGFIHYAATEEKQFCLTPDYVPLSGEDAELLLAHRYFAHYGPATIHDAMYFFHVTAAKVKKWLSAMDVKSISCQGKTYYSLHKSACESAAIPSCIYLAGFDPLLMGYEKKENLYLDQRDLRKIFNLSGIVMPAILKNGRITGKWKIKNKSLMIELFYPSASTDRAMLEEAAAATFAGLREIRFL